jgi:hypothetical protein
MTSALFYDPDGRETRYTSERNADSDTALSVGRTAGVFPTSGRPNIVDHVEVKAAAGMRKVGVLRGVMVINNPAGPCGGQGTAPDPHHPDQLTFTETR